MDKIDNKICIIKFYFEFANLKLKNLKNIAKFIEKADILAKKLLDSQIIYNIAII